MRCLGRTNIKNLTRCKNAAKFLVCHHHKFQPIILILVTIPTIFATYIALYIFFIKPVSDSTTSADTTILSAIEPFPEIEGGFNILILPFDPLEECKIKQTYMEEAIRKRLLSISERDSLNLQVKIDMTQCVSTFEEGKKVGKAYNADLVIWGDLYELCLTDSTKACLKYAVLKEGIRNIETVGQTGIETIASMTDITEGFLQKDIDYIIYWSLGLEAYDKENYRCALTHFEKIEAEFSEKYVELPFNLGVCYYVLKHYDESADSFKDALKINPNVSEAHYNFAILLNDHFQDYKGAREHYEKALEIDPNFSEAHNNFAGLLKDQYQDYKGAREHYKKSIEINPNLSEAHYGFAVLLQTKFQEYEGARDQYEKALEINPNDSKAHYNFGILLKDHFQDYKGAREHYEKALEINPNYSEAHNNFANLLQTQFQDYKGAREHYEKALEINPNYSEVHYDFAILLETKFKEYEEAREHYEKALEINPNYSEAHYNFAILLKKHFQDYEAAQSHYLKACELNPDIKSKERDDFFGIDSDSD